MISKISSIPIDISIFTQSFLILLREGAEVIIILTALFLAIKALKLPQKHFYALFAGAGIGILTASIIALFIAVFSSHVSAHLALLEGVTLLLASIVLVFVSSWFFGQRKSLSLKKISTKSYSLLGIFTVGFLMTFRESAETVLFIYALIAAEGFEALSLISGSTAALLLLTTLSLIIYTLGVSIPLKPFFLFTAIGLFVLSFIYAGKGMHELQEYGIISETLIPGIPKIKALGLYPYIETLLMQLYVILFAIMLNALAKIKGKAKKS